ncbi:MAG: hypothetical protein HPM95_12550 [Alphaproteobacteria bacterium]|nr:hypothetical protein [Alphaproteobacteria bacterium]
MRKLWLQGLSASQIAYVMAGVTRNAVIGKAHRMGFRNGLRPRAIVQSSAFSVASRRWLASAASRRCVKAFPVPGPAAATISISRPLPSRRNIPSSRRRTASR